MALRVAFLDQSGNRTSGAQESLALLLSALPSTVEPVVVVFRSGIFEQRLRAEGHEVIVHAVGEVLSQASRFSAHPLSTVAAAVETVKLAAVLRRIRPDIVHTNTVKAHIIGLPAARLSGIPAIMHLRDSLDSANRAILVALARYAATRTIAVSRHVSEWYGVGGTRVIYNPFERCAEVDADAKKQAREALMIPSSVPAIGIVGPIHPNKGHERFLRVMASLANVSDAFGVIVGDARFSEPDAIPALRDRARDLGIRDRIRFVPWLNDVTQAYHALDVLCNCSTREPFGRTIAEAAAHGVPSVMFDDCGASEIFKDRVSGAIVRSHDEHAMAARLFEIASYPDLRLDLGANARRAVTELSVDRHAAEVTRIYREMNG